MSSVALLRLKCPPDRESNCAPVFNEITPYGRRRCAAVISPCVRVPGEYQAERDINDRHLDAELSAEAIPVIIKYTMRQLGQKDLPGQSLVPDNIYHLEPRRQRAAALGRSGLPYLALSGYFPSRIECYRCQSLIGHELPDLKLVGQAA